MKSSWVINACYGYIVTLCVWVCFNEIQKKTYSKKESQVLLINTLLLSTIQAVVVVICTKHKSYKSLFKIVMPLSHVKI